jgi:hypothetical protein
MNILEKEIEDLIWQGIVEDRPLLRKKGIWIWESATYHRQVDFGSYGIADIIGLQVPPKQDGYRHINAHIIEIKKDEINSATFFQALRYAKAITRIIEKKLTNTSCTCGITLIGKTVDKKSDFIYLPDILANVALYTYKLDFQHGIFFKRESDYFAANESFPDLNALHLAAVGMVCEKIKARQGEDLPF